MCEESFTPEIINFQFKLNENKEIIFVSTMLILDFNFLSKGLHLVKHAARAHCRPSVASPAGRPPAGLSSLLWTLSEAKA